MLVTGSVAVHRSSVFCPSWNQPGRSSRIGNKSRNGHIRRRHRAIVGDRHTPRHTGVTSSCSATHRCNHPRTSRCATSAHPTVSPSGRSAPRCRAGRTDAGLTPGRARNDVTSASLYASVTPASRYPAVDHRRVRERRRPVRSDLPGCTNRSRIDQRPPIDRHRTDRRCAVRGDHHDVLQRPRIRRVDHVHPVRSDRPRIATVTVYVITSPVRAGITPGVKTLPSWSPR